MWYVADDGGDAHRGTLTRGRVHTACGIQFGSPRTSFTHASADRPPEFATITLCARCLAEVASC